MEAVSEHIIAPSPEETKVLIECLRDEQVLREVKEQAALLDAGHHGLRETLPLRDGGDDIARFECFIPKNFYWTRRAKYGRELFTTDAGQKDLKRHHPEFFTTTVSGKVTSGYGGKYDGRTVQTRGRVQFARGTLNLAP